MRAPNFVGRIKRALCFWRRATNPAGQDTTVKQARQPAVSPSVLKRNVAVLARCRTALAIGTFCAHTRHVKGHTNSQDLSIVGVGLRIVNYEHSRILSIPGARSRQRQVGPDAL